MQNSPRLQRVPTLQRITEIGATTDKAVSALSMTVGATADCVLSRGTAGDMTFGDSITYNDRKLQDVRVNRLWRSINATDFDTTTETAWVGAAVATGTTSTINGTANHPGQRRVASAAAATTGFYYSATAGSAIGGVGDKIVVVFYPTTNLSLFYSGYSGNPNAAPLIGAWIGISALTATGYTNDGAGSSNTTGTTYALSQNVWYRAEVETATTGSIAYFRIYTCSDQVLVWTESLTPNYGNGLSVYPSFLALSNAAGGPYNLCDLDFCSYENVIDLIR